MIPLRLRRRRDGTLCLTDAHGSTSSPDRVFPEEHLFTHAWLANNSSSANLNGDTLAVTLANAKAAYRVAEQLPIGAQAVLVKSELFDAPPVDEKAAGALAAARAVVDAPSSDVANSGSAAVGEK